MADALTKFDNMDDYRAHRVTRNATEMSADVMQVLDLFAGTGAIHWRDA